MKLHPSQYIIDEKSILTYYEIRNSKPKLLLLHAQGTDSSSYAGIAKKLAKHYHIYLVDYYGHGKSSHNREKYHLSRIGDDIISFIEHVIRDTVTVSGHSSGGLIAAYIAANSDLCTKLILEDPPFFSCIGDRRYNTYNYKDLSSVCHDFLAQDKESDFVYYYFVHQYCWNFFPDNSRETVRNKLSALARTYRTKHPNKNLKVPFWPKQFLEGFKGMQNYDPFFGEAFHSDSFHRQIDYTQLLSQITCPTLFLKANTTIGENGLLQGALSDSDLAHVGSLIKHMDTVYFDCGHSIHTEKPKEFAAALIP